MIKIVPVYIFICSAIASGYLAVSAIAIEPDYKPLAIDNFRLPGNKEATLSKFLSERENNVTKVLIMAGLVSTIGAFGWCLSWYGKSSGSKLIPSNRSNSALLQRVSPRLRRKLLRLINDPKTANRLLMGIQQHHRDRSANWLAEKAIYDLRRGR